MPIQTLTPEQETAASHFSGPALTLAIPGSGKTTVLIHRLMHLVESHEIDPKQILTLTFSKTSAVDMQKRCLELIDQPYSESFEFMTIHKFAYGLYTNYLKQKGLEKRLVDEGSEKFKILSQIYRHYQHQQLTEDDFETLSSQIGLIYNLKLKPTSEKHPDFAWDTIFDMARAYHRFKTENNLFDFDDMLLNAIRLLKKNPGLLESVRKRYPFIQVDEAQDTSKLQFELIELLAGPSANLFLVADDDQSIYGFRGAYPEYLLEFPNRFENARLYPLNINFRSDENIVKTASSMIQLNEKRYQKDMKAYFSAVNRPNILWFDDLFRRNEYLVKALDSKDHTSAILYRNKISALSIMDLLIRNNIEFSVKDAPVGELNHWLIKDLLAFFTLAMIPQDLESFERIAFKTNGYISREMVNYVKANQRGRDIFSVLVETPFLEDYQTRTQERLQDQFESLRRLRPFDAIHFIETELGYLDYLKRNSERLGASMNFSRTRLDAYKAIAKPLKTAFEFMERISVLEDKIIEFRNQESNIVLSTIHGSKGLEFDRVYMIDVNPNIFPGFKSTENDALEEERRLFYVGLTRARHTFELLHCEFINGAFNPNSRFIEEFMRQPFTNHQFHNVTGKPAPGKKPGQFTI